MEPLETTLTARDGSTASYLIVPIRPSKSIDLALNILACVAQPGARLLKLGMEAQGLDTDVEALGAFVGTLDLSALGADAEVAIRAIAARPDLVRRLFEGCIRNEKDMSNDAQFDLAYGGNWGEMYQAIKVIIQHNGLLPFLDSLSS